MVGGTGVMLSIQENEKITRTVPILKLNTTEFSFNFFFCNGYSNFFLIGQARGGLDFFLHITILFNQCSDKNIIYQQFYCGLRYIVNT